MQLVERPLLQVQLDRLPPDQRIAGNEALADSALGHRQTGAHMGLADIQNLAGRTPGQELRIPRHIIDQLEKGRGRVR
ncbi:hypothetical protein D3C72_2407830 [compost metagenome]